MAENSRPAALFRPSPVSVHDHGDVTRKACGIDLGEQLCFVRIRLDYFGEVFVHYI